MLIDLHAHSSGISQCCRGSAEEIIKIAKESGIDGIVLTNHYQEYYVENCDAGAFARKYTDEYRKAKCLGEKMGITIIYGMEVTMNLHDGSHLLIYGLDESFTEEFPEMYNMSQAELYSLVKERGGLLIQAHPFRERYYPLDPRYLDGYEISCHPIYRTSRYDDVVELALKHRAILTSGGDYHMDTPYRPYCGMFLPDTVKTTEQLANYLKNTNVFRLSVHEPEDEQRYDVVYDIANGLIEKKAIL